MWSCGGTTRGHPAVEVPHDERCERGYFGSGNPPPEPEIHLDLVGDVGGQVRLVRWQPRARCRRAYDRWLFRVETLSTGMASLDFVENRMMSIRATWLSLVVTSTTARIWPPGAMT